MRITILITFLIVFLIPQGVGADAIRDKQNELNKIQKEIDAQNKLLEQKSGERKTLANQVSIMDGQITQTQYSLNKTQAEIDLAQAEIGKLKIQIKQKEEELSYQKEVLNETLRVVYEETDVGLIETLFSSNNISEVLDRTEYLGAIEGKVSDTMEQITKIRMVLANNQTEQENKKNELVDKKNTLEQQKDAVAAQKYAKDQVLAETRGEESRYQAIIKNLQNERASANDALQQELAKQYENGGGGHGGGTGGYPWANVPQDSISDPWGFLVRECTSYVAWNWNWRIGRPWYRGSGPPGTGDARNWATILAPRNGYSVYSTPRRNSIAVWEWGTYGHVAIVEKVYGDGTFDVSEYNVIPGQYGERQHVYNTSGIKFIDVNR